jgi:hypothetical protein
MEAAIAGEATGDNSKLGAAWNETKQAKAIYSFWPRVAN